MPLQNRVQPTGEILAIPARGTLMGNRGILHGDDQRLGLKRWQHPHWVTCVTKYKDWHRQVMQPRNYTELFFLDEPTALAAGHRPCGLCRHKDYAHFKSLFNRANGTQTLAQIDTLMHRDRVTRTRQQVRHSAHPHHLPNGSFALFEDHPHLIWSNHLLRYTPSGYSRAIACPQQALPVLTPKCTVATLAQGYCPTPHPSALALL